MSQIIVSPREQRAFSRALSDLAEDLRQRESALNRELADLGRTWADAHYTRFNRANEEMALYLLAFYNRTRTYCEYLNRKAAAGEKYLGT